LGNKDYVSELTARMQAETRQPLAPSGAFFGANNLQDQAQVYLKMEAAQDAHTDSTNAAILGYKDSLLGAQAGDEGFRALIAELEQHRYYVVLLAYDNRAAREFGRYKLLWEARISIPERGNDFNKSLSAMALVLSKYLGQDSNGLIHKSLMEGHVEVGEPRSINTVP
jgi:hypothetical protein